MTPIWAVPSGRVLTLKRAARVARIEALGMSTWNTEPGRAKPFTSKAASPETRASWMVSTRLPLSSRVMSSSDW